MGCVITVHHPNLTEQERKYRMEQIKQATINYYREVQKNERKNQNSSYRDITNGILPVNVSNG